MDTLRLLSNCYKHDPSKGPGVPLLRRLSLNTSPIYMPLPESPAFQKGLAVYLGLQESATFVDIAEEFLRRAGSFLADLRTTTQQTGQLSTWAVNLFDPQLYGV